VKQVCGRNNMEESWSYYFSMKAWVSCFCDWSTSFNPFFIVWDGQYCVSTLKVRSYNSSLLLPSNTMKSQMKVLACEHWETLCMRCIFTLLLKVLAWTKAFRSSTFAASYRDSSLCSQVKNFEKGIVILKFHSEGELTYYEPEMNWLKSFMLIISWSNENL